MWVSAKKENGVLESTFGVVEIWIMARPTHLENFPRCQGRIPVADWPFIVTEKLEGIREGDKSIGKWKVSKPVGFMPNNVDNVLYGLSDLPLEVVGHFTPHAM